MREGAEAEQVRQHPGKALVAMRWRECPTPARLSFRPVGAIPPATSCIGAEGATFTQNRPEWAVRPGWHDAGLPSMVVIRGTWRVFLGEDILIWLVLALGGAMAVGNLMAIVRPPETKRDDEDLERAPVWRSLVFVVVGVVAAVWAVASLASG